MNTAQAFTDWFAPTYGREYGAPIMEGDPVFIVAGRYLALGFTPAVGKPSPEAAEEADRLAEEQARLSIGAGSHDRYEPYLYPVQFLGRLVEAEWAAGGRDDVVPPAGVKPINESAVIAAIDKMADAGEELKAALGLL